MGMTLSDCSYGTYGVPIGPCAKARCCVWNNQYKTRKHANAQTR